MPRSIASGSPSLDEPSGTLFPVRIVAAFAGLLLATTTSSAADNFSGKIRPILQTYCFDCHGDGHDKGGVNFDDLDAQARHDPKLWYRVLKNTRAGLMPPAGETPLPAGEAQKLSDWIKREAFGLDPAQPDPGRVTLRRLNRQEYRNTIRDLTGVDYDTAEEFPADDTGYGFDNIGDVLTLSPMLLEKYLDAAQAIVGKYVATQPRVMARQWVPGHKFATVFADTTLPPTPPSASAAGSAESAGRSATPPVGEVGRRRRPANDSSRDSANPPPPSRPLPTLTDSGSLDLSYYTPARVATTHRVEHAGRYQVTLEFRAVERYVDNVFDRNRCRLTFKIDGETVLERELGREGDRRFELPVDRDWAAGEHELSVEITPLTPNLPANRNLRVRLTGVAVRGPADEKFWVANPDYARVFRREVPADAEGRRRYARELLGNFANRAYRRPIDDPTLDRLVTVAEAIYSTPPGRFEDGVAQGLVAVLASPRFLFREDFTEPLRPGQAHPFVDEYSLASRLSYFLWSSMPDEELLRLAGQGRLRAELGKQLDRMLAHPRSAEFVRHFTGQWLQARDLDHVQITATDVFLRDHPQPGIDEARASFRRLQRIPAERRTPEQQAEIEHARAKFAEFNRLPKPELNGDLRRSMQQETEQTFAHVLREDRSLLELIESDYTFLNETLARHYGIEGVTGSRFRKVTLPPGSPRGGVLTQGTVLTVTSNPTRTSPVKRGVFILEAILGAPPPPPPPNIPALEDAAPASELRKLNLRETLALHATKPLCASCHLRMDPLGLALENFNALGVWRTADSGQPIEPAGKLITGETFSDVRELKRVLATSRHRDFYLAFTEKLLTYALGRGADYYDVDTIEALAARLEASGGRPSALLRGIVESAPFQQRRQPKPALASDVLSPDLAPRSLAVAPP